MHKLIDIFELDPMIFMKKVFDFQRMNDFFKFLIKELDKPVIS